MLRGARTVKNELWHTFARKTGNSHLAEEDFSKEILERASSATASTRPTGGSAEVKESDSSTEEEPMQRQPIEEEPADAKTDATQEQSAAAWEKKMLKTTLRP